MKDTEKGCFERWMENNARAVLQTQVKGFYGIESDVVERPRNMRPEKRPLCSVFMKSLIVPKKTLTMEYLQCKPDYSEKRRDGKWLEEAASLRHYTLTDSIIEYI